MNLDELTPYQSLIVAEIGRGDDGSTPPAELLDLVVNKLGSSSWLEVRRGQGTEAELECSFVSYRVDSQVTWTHSTALSNITHHLLLVCVRHGLGLAAIHAIEERTRTSIERALVDGGLRPLAPVAPDVLAAAFADGDTRALWLSGTHRRTPIRADAKALYGLDLSHSLAHWDQSYYATAVRALSTSLGMAVGVAPLGSRVWVKSSATWQAFLDTTDRLLTHLVATRARAGTDPLPSSSLFSGLLARPSDGHDAAEAFDACLQPDIEGPAQPDPASVADDSTRQDLAEQCVLRFVQARGQAFDLDVVARQGCDTVAAGTVLGRLRCTPTKTRGRHRWRLRVERLPGADHPPLLEQIMRAIKRPERVVVHYESGHTLAGGQFYLSEYRDLPFQGWQWHDFTGFEVDREKPTHDEQLGSGASLFDWVVTQWPPDNPRRGLLICDDGSGEVADFVHLRTDTERPILSLVHAKGAHAATNARDIAVTPYEVVLSQALKNVRHLSLEHLVAALRAPGSARSRGLAWRDGRPRERTDLISELSRLGTDYDRQVVIVQPHVMQARHDTIRTTPGSHAAVRMRQLDALLLGAQGVCQESNATLVVIGDGTDFSAPVATAGARSSRPKPRRAATPSPATSK